MSTITKFSAIGGLYCVWNVGTGQSTVTKTGNTVTAVTAVAGEGTNPTAQLVAKSTDAGHIITHGVDSINAMPALASPTGNNQSGFHFDFSPALPANEFTIVWTEQRYDAANGNYSLQFRRSGSGSHGYFYRSGTDLRAIVHAGTLTTVGNTTDQYFAAAIAAGTGANNSKIRFSVENGPSAEVALPHTQDRHPVELGFMNQAAAGSTQSIQGKTSILAIYNRKLTDAEIDSVLGLCNYWLLNNSAPASGPPTNGCFAEVSTDNNGSVNTWQWQESANGTDYSNVGLILTDVTGDKTRQMCVNSAPLSANGLYIRCQAVSNEGAVAYSNAGRLWVQAPT